MLLTILPQLTFFIILATSIALFAMNVRKINRNIKLGREIKRNDQPGRRWNLMARVAMGQTKMLVRPIPGLLHLFVYVGFVIINIEVVEIILDGLFGTHRLFAPFLGDFYNFLIASFEILALLVLVGVFAFFARRNIMHINRFRQPDLNGFPRNDANIILGVEVLLMSAFLSMNAADFILQGRGAPHYEGFGSFPVSKILVPLFQSWSTDTLITFERFMWWFHIVGILLFMNYLPYSKHLHIVMAFPNVWHSKLEPKGQLENMDAVTREVKLMLDPSVQLEEVSGPVKFGAKDVQDLTWKNLMDAYSCTECGRCTAECPANITGKLLSPRRIMMKTRDRLEEVGKNIDANKGSFADDGKALLHSYITPEELWACTTCNACTEACPVNIDPVNIIMQLRQQLVMEESAPPTSLGTMFSNMENNGAPWQFSPNDRGNWRDEA